MQRVLERRAPQRVRVLERRAPQRAAEPLVPLALMAEHLNPKAVA